MGVVQLNAAGHFEPGFLGEDAHEHDDDVTSFVFRSDVAFDQTSLKEFLRELVAEHARDLMRYKGIVSFDGLDCRVVFQGVHMLMNSDIAPPWADGEVRNSTSVFIGRNLPRERISDALTRC